MKFNINVIGKHEVTLTQKDISELSKGLSLAGEDGCVMVERPMRCSNCIWYCVNEMGSRCYLPRSGQFPIMQPADWCQAYKEQDND